jgi:UDP-N-acetylglucosamine 2-epimerase (non-hydrolysing)
MKIAPVVRALRAQGQLDWKIVHTGQHHDHNMSAVFFEELGIPAPDVNFGCSGGSHASQTARVMQAFEDHCAAERPSAVVVVGDVNSTLACALVAKKAGIPVAHIEAGLRSGDRRMPEEINRIATDAISDWFFVTEPSGADHLRHEGHAEDRIFHVGHVMVDNVMHQAWQLANSGSEGLDSEPVKAVVGPRYGVVTLHRPSNVDDAHTLAGIVGALNEIAAELPLVFPVHPRTFAGLKHLEGDHIRLCDRVHLMPPQAYMSFLNLWKDATLVLTDSGGLQEETTALGVPCLTLRDNTERPITVEQGTNTLAGTDPARITALALQRLRETEAPSIRRTPPRRPALWDGLAAVRIVNILASQLT